MHGESDYTRKHWGIKPTQQIDIDDPDLPDELVEWGRLKELHFRPLNSKMLKKDSVLSLDNPKKESLKYKLNKKEANKSHLAYDPHHRFGRLYTIVAPAVAKQNLKNFWNKSPLTPIPLDEIAVHMGGRHGTEDYPDVDVKPVGVLTHVVYACEKKGDGYSFYIHHMGEESGVQPALCVDAQGRLHIAGGNYESLTPGITD